ncbi:Hypothetical predicted protein, partial [Mytilus galloprovincialis]
TCPCTTKKTNKQMWSKSNLAASVNVRFIRHSFVLSVHQRTPNGRPFVLSEHKCNTEMTTVANYRVFFKVMLVMVYEVVSEPLLVAAIDFGTTFSGYAFQTLSDFKEDPLRIQGFAWTTGSNAGLSLKTPTCVLFDPAQNFYSFGIEAEDKYTELAQEEDHANWYYFRRFKMNLYKSQDIPRDLMLEDDKGKLLPAMKVISESIKFMREHLMRTLSKKGQDVIRPNEINWVLTVPAIWSDAAKQFMREAAVKGGIPNSQLMLALEPEAASIYCKHIPSERMVCGGKSTLDAFSPGTKYLILDAGGGTIDITVQEVQTDGTIKQLYMANGGDWGGTKVDEAFEAFLVDLLGAPAISRFREDDKAGHLDLLREFEIKKRSIKPDSSSKVTFKVPISLKDAHEKETGQDLKESMSRSTKRVAWVGDKLRMEADSARELFKSPCNYITEHLEEIFGDPKVRGTNIILMVGGFSDSPMLRDAVESAFPGKIIIIPDEAGLAVLKGAVQFGFEPRIISSRICKATHHINLRRNARLAKVVDADYAKNVLDSTEYFKGVFKVFCRQISEDVVNVKDEGGTVDITVQEVQTDGSIKQLYMANGGDWGGTKVDQAFDEYMMELAGPATVYKFRDEDKAGHLDLCREFEIKKRNIQPDQTSKVTFRVPSTLSEIFKREEVTWVGDKLRVDAALAQGFFDSTCQHIVQHLKGIFKEEKVRGTDTILMVGGFSDSPMLRKAVEVSFPDKNIIIPHEAGLAVLKGAVQYGYEPRIISTRICKFTYGVRTNSRFKEGIDPESKRKIRDGKSKCGDSFSKHVIIGQAVHINEAIEEKMYYPSYSDQTKMRVSIYTSTEEDPRYTDDPSCAYLGELTVQMPDTSGGKHRQVSVQLTFGGTEIEVKATKTGTGEETKAFLNFLR